MERLTSKRCSGIKQGYWSPHPKEEVVQRLGAYEDTGITLEDMKRAFDEDAVLKLAGQVLGVEPSSLRGTVSRWISVADRLPESNHKNNHVGDVLCYVPPRNGCHQSGLYIGKLCFVAADDGSGNFWGRPMPESDWTLWGWGYFEKPVVTHWMPLPEPPKEV